MMLISFVFNNSDLFSLLVIENCNRQDAGKYELMIENQAGSKMAHVNVKVLDSPGPVSSLGVKEVRNVRAINFRSKMKVKI